MPSPRQYHLDTCALMRPESVKPNGVARKGVKCTCAKAKAARAARLAAQRGGKSIADMDLGVSIGNGNYVRPIVRVE